MSSGLIALLDDLAALTKLAATTLDDAGAQAAKAGSKAAGIVIDDAAVTPRYVVGLTADRELPIIRKIAKGSLKNKLLFLLPGALLLSWLAPWVITPLLMAGGAFLCMEGYHKVMHLVSPDSSHHDAEVVAAPQTAQELELERIASAIRTDFILSAEIMAITLASVATASMWMQGVVLAVVGVGMTFLVYGAVAVIVKADDFGLLLARSRQGLIQKIGRAIVAGMPLFLSLLSFVGMIAMLWVGGGILTHGLHEMGTRGPEEVIHHAAESVAAYMPSLSGFLIWLTTASICAVLGVVVGAIVDLLATHILKPIQKKFKGQAV